ncbi:MAG: nucleoside triphosphate pyrophosphohydrolase [Candidatus Riflebacteria bacterium]|nr:nucleoside triphosphate pyrophosphohydrolase [Candidatus Riflebacteria bacterium]
MKNKDINIIKSQFYRLVEIMQTLRAPNGCAWDQKQTLLSMAKHIKGETDELIQALEKNDILNIKEELGDLLMTIVFTAEIASEKGLFDIGEVAYDICEKMILRHPHIFGDKANDINSDQVLKLWNEQKVSEKQLKNKPSYRINQALAFANNLKKAEKVQAIAAEVGFDFSSHEDAFVKIIEEANEIKDVLNDKKKLQEEIGDLLFAVINVSRLAEIDADQALANASEKFAKRFTAVETIADNNGGFNGKSMEELDRYWNEVKKNHSSGD